MTTEQQMTVVYAGEAPPFTFKKSLFLAGPSPRKASDPNWREEALRDLAAMGYDGVVYVPLPRDGLWPDDYTGQVEWERRYLATADVIVFWVPRSDELPGFTTNIEWGEFYDSGRAILGYPRSATKMRYPAYMADVVERMPSTECGTLFGTLRAALAQLGDGALRTGGEREVPLNIWNLPYFQNWLQTQKAVGNQLDGARVLWTFRVGEQRWLTFAYALHVNVFVAAEGRNKTNEFIIGRPYVSAVVALHRPTFAPVADTRVLIVREFRSPARTSDGFIHELPCGSASSPTTAYATALAELNEETGLQVDPMRLMTIGVRQVAGTLSVHQAHVFALRLTGEELVKLEAECAATARGVEADTERTFVEVHRLGDLLRTDSNLVDWSTLGMVFAALFCE